MDNKKDDKYYLKKIVNDLSFLINHTSGKTKTEIESEEILIDSIMFRLVQISENSDKLSADFKITNANLPWLEIKGMGINCT